MAAGQNVGLKGHGEQEYCSSKVGMRGNKSISQAETVGQARSMAAGWSRAG